VHRHRPSRREPATLTAFIAADVDDQAAARRVAARSCGRRSAGSARSRACARSRSDAGRRPRRRHRRSPPARVLEAQVIDQPGLRVRGIRRQDQLARQRPPERRPLSRGRRALRLRRPRRRRPRGVARRCLRGGGARTPCQHARAERAGAHERAAVEPRSLHRRNLVAGGPDQERRRTPRHGARPATAHARRAWHPRGAGARRRRAHARPPRQSVAAARHPPGRRRSLPTLSPSLDGGQQDDLREQNPARRDLNVGRGDRGAAHQQRAVARWWRRVPLPAGRAGRAGAGSAPAAAAARAAPAGRALWSRSSRSSRSVPSRGASPSDRRDPTGRRDRRSPDRPSSPDRCRRSACPALPIR
jgi:hypothetical protein